MLIVDRLPWRWPIHYYNTKKHIYTNKTVKIDVFKSPRLKKASVSEDIVPIIPIVVFPVEYIIAGKVIAPKTAYGI